MSEDNDDWEIPEIPSPVGLSVLVGGIWALLHMDKYLTAIHSVGGPLSEMAIWAGWAFLIMSGVYVALLSILAMILVLVVAYLIHGKMWSMIHD